MLDIEQAPYFVDVKWLSENLSDPNLRVLDATWSVPGSSSDLPDGTIPGAKFFDLGYLKSKTPLGAAYPPSDVLKTMSEELGLSPDNHIIVYDKQGYFSAARVWWSLKTIGHKKVSVLRDGFPAWAGADRKIAENLQSNETRSDYKVSNATVKGVSIEAVLAAISSDTQIIDARPPGRFSGETPEPREGLRAGHIPSSLNLPLGRLKTAQGELLEDNEIHQILEEEGINKNSPIITTCGSGVTAAALALIFEHLGYEDVSVYTGSWAEYGATEHPVETT